MLEQLDKEGLENILSIITHEQIKLVKFVCSTNPISNKTAYYGIDEQDCYYCLFSLTKDENKQEIKDKYIKVIQSTVNKINENGGHLKGTRIIFSIE